MKRQSAEEYTKERARTPETPEKKIERLMKEAYDIADTNDIPFVAATSEVANFSGKAKELLIIMAVVMARISMKVGASAERTIELTTKVVKRAYEAAKNYE